MLVKLVCTPRVWNGDGARNDVLNEPRTETESVAR